MKALIRIIHKMRRLSLMHKVVHICVKFSYALKFFMWKWVANEIIHLQLVLVIKFLSVCVLDCLMGRWWALSDTTTCSPLILGEFQCVVIFERFRTAFNICECHSVVGSSFIFCYIFYMLAKLTDLKMTIHM